MWALSGALVVLKPNGMQKYKHFFIKHNLKIIFCEKLFIKC